MVYSVLLVTILYIINVLYEWSPILIMIFLLLFLLFKITNLLIHSDIISLVTGSANDHLFETSKNTLYYNKNMSIKSEIKGLQSSSICLMLCFVTLKSSKLYLMT